MPKGDSKKKESKVSLGQVLTLRIAAVGIFSALAFCLAFFFAIPYAGGAGYFNFGDAITLLVSMAFGPIEGSLVGIVSGGLSDFASGFGSFIPWTVVSKGLMGLVSGGLFYLLRKRKAIRFLAPILGGIVMMAVYLIAYIIMFGANYLMASLFDAIQGLGCALISIGIYIPLEKTGVLRHLRKS